MRRNRSRRERFFQVKANGEVGVKDEGHGYQVAGGSIRCTSVNTLKNAGWGCEVRLTGGVHYLIG
jgi:hypothetical protein